MIYRAGAGSGLTWGSRGLCTPVFCTCVLRFPLRVCLFRVPHPKVLFLCLNFPSNESLPPSSLCRSLHSFIYLLVHVLIPQSQCIQPVLCPIHCPQCSAYTDEEDTVPPSLPVWGGYHTHEWYTECREGGTRDVQGRDFLPGTGDIILI